MKVNEIFGSIDGEGLRTGELTTFIRLTYCNLVCRFCDSTYAFHEGTEMSIDDILEKCQEIGYHNITFTGGEPLIHKDVDVLIDRLIEEGYGVNIETNGAVDVSPYLTKDCILTVDYKTPASGMQGKMIDDMFNKLRDTDVVKFVMNRDDMDFVENFIKTHNLRAWVYFSPIFGEIEPVELVEFMKKLDAKGLNTRKFRVQVQLHKIIWDPNKRGV